jgi:predicted dehydrogenase
VALASGIRVMAAQVIRFWPEYVFAREAVRSGRYGEVLAVDCRRLSAPPDWNSWMLKPDTGGGAVIDLQVHDLDFVCQLLGPPRAVRAVGREVEGAFNAVCNELVYESGVSVHTEASFVMPPPYPFRMAFRIDLEQATLEMDSWRPEGRQLQVFTREGETVVPEIEQRNAYGAEIDYFARRLLDGEPFREVPLAESITALELCLASAEACRTGETVPVDRAANAGGER